MVITGLMYAYSGGSRNMDQRPLRLITMVPGLSLARLRCGLFLERGANASLTSCQSDTLNK